MRPPRLLVACALVLVLPVVLAQQMGARVAQVRPSAPEVPANLLRLSIEFTAPVEGPVLPRISLMHSDGRPLQEPFLPQELWSPDGTILTLLLHPGRVKTGLVAREQLGPILHVGDDVLLTFDGRPIKKWKVGAEDVNGPVASAWRLSPVRSGSRETLVVKLEAPIDGRDKNYIAVVDSRDQRVVGSTALEDGETTWSFMPDAPWQIGKYRLVVRSTLEDPAGNPLGGHFESPLGSPRKPPKDALVYFHVGFMPR